MASMTQPRGLYKVPFHTQRPEVILPPPRVTANPLSQLSGLYTLLHTSTVQSTHSDPSTPPGIATCSVFTPDCELCKKGRREPCFHCCDPSLSCKGGWINIRWMDW